MEKIDATMCIATYTTNTQILTRKFTSVCIVLFPLVETLDLVVSSEGERFRGLNRNRNLGSDWLGNRNVSSCRSPSLSRVFCATSSPSLLLLLLPSLLLSSSFTSLLSPPLVPRVPSHSHPPFFSALLSCNNSALDNSTSSATDTLLTS